MNLFTVIHKPKGSLGLENCPHNMSRALQQLRKSLIPHGCPFVHLPPICQSLFFLYIFFLYFNVKLKMFIMVDTHRETHMDTLFDVKVYFINSKPQIVSRHYCPDSLEQIHLTQSHATHTLPVRAQRHTHTHAYYHAPTESHRYMFMR